ncbi:hypothetical protein GGR55DRAFT_335444 [Xylaria sp. FL0064]|nr:hypothetical protein GGR55DRAFT_335444 [Xylaria sp. FL0064]
MDPPVILLAGSILLHSTVYPLGITIHSSCASALLLYTRSTRATYSTLTISQAILSRIQPWTVTNLTGRLSAYGTRSTTVSWPGLSEKL